MSFLFSFSGDDIEEEEDSNSSIKPGDTKDTTGVQTAPSNAPDILVTQLQHTTLKTTLLPPKRHTLAELLTSIPSQISYNYLNVPVRTSDHDAQSTPDDVKSIRVPRRSLFDIRQQLMAESDPSSNDDETGSLLADLETGDLRSGIYEGGFKTWECAVDLGGFVAGEFDRGEAAKADDVWNVVELGAGSAIPSLVLLQSLLTRRIGEWTEKPRKVKLTLCDYNEDVLRLGTAVNVFLSVALSRNGSSMNREEDEEGEIEVDQDSVQDVLKALEDADIEVDFISGAWGDEFVQHTRSGEADKNTRLLVLASETIYSPGSLNVFSQTVLDLLGTTQGLGKAYIAAKNFYFGVGGGVQEFEEEIKGLGGATSTVLDVKSAGVGRVVLEVLSSRQ